MKYLRRTEGVTEIRKKFAVKNLRGTTVIVGLFKGNGAREKSVASKNDDEDAEREIG